MADSTFTRPHFLGIGAARSGTTWLGSVLSESDRVWIPRRKELHYFSRSRKYGSSSMLEPPTAFARLFANGEGSRRFRRELVRAFGSTLLNPSLEQARWNYRYFMTRNDAPGWYPGLFPSDPGLVCGEITPAYALLDSDDVESIARRFPDLRIIYLMRNPVDRAWSTISYHHKRGQIDLSTMSKTDMLDYLSNSKLTSRSSYPTVVERWSACFGEHRLLLAFYDEIVDSPGPLQKRVFDFLELELPASLKTREFAKINASRSSQIPDEIRRMLAEQYEPVIKETAAKLGGYAQTWYEQLY